MEGPASAPADREDRRHGLSGSTRSGRGLAMARTITARFAADQPFGGELPGGGRLALDRALPFLAVYRSPPGRADAGAADLVGGLAAYLVAPGEAVFQDDVDRVIRAVADVARERLGAFLLLELWTASGPEGEVGAAKGDVVPPPSVFRVVVEDSRHLFEAQRLEEALRTMRLCTEGEGDLGVPSRAGEVVVEVRERATPPGLSPLVPGQPCVRVGLEVSAFFRHAGSGKPYPRVVAALRREIARAVEAAAFAFAQERTSFDAPHRAALGRRRIDDAVRHVDARLGEIYGAFDTLLQVTPLNAEEAWERFRACGYERASPLRYRPLPFDPEETKRRLFNVPIERVEDPLLNHLFREKQEELDREISLVRSVETEGFRWASYQIHGTVREPLLELAEKILERLPGSGSGSGTADEEEPATGWVDAQDFARRARREVERYRAVAPDFAGGVEIRDDVAAGLMVSKGVLLVSRSLRAPERRVQALLDHEVGTHVVTYANGVLQPLRLFAAGLAGYEGLQEGLAVLAEHLAGGLTRQRMRVLAARVLAVRSIIEGAGFVDTWRLLAREHGFAARSAFVVTLRVHRGGGFTKDAVYLRGLRDLLTYLSGADASLDHLLVGKVGLTHATAVQELVLRGVLRVPAVKPRYLNDPDALARLAALRGRGVPDLIDGLAA